MPIPEFFGKFFSPGGDDAKKAGDEKRDMAKSKEQGAMSRRQALRELGKIGALGAMTAVELNLMGGKHSTAEAGIKPSQTAEKTVKKEHHDSRFEAVNTTTAAAVSGLFINWIRRCAKGDSFGPRSAIELNTAEAVRIAALQTLGGKEGKEKAAEESAAIYESLMLVPALITASDFTARSVAVHPERIFKEAEDIIAGAERQERERPSFEASAAEWKEYLSHVNERITTEVAELEALSTVIAPFLTTYTSSAVANKLKESVMRLTFEQSVAQNAVEGAARKSKTDQAQLLEKSLARTQELFDGSFGFNNLQTTLAANIHGGFLLGDPPQVYGFKNHKDRPERLAKAEALGLANSEIMTATLTSVWLKKAGVPLSADLYKTYFSAQARVLGEIGKLSLDTANTATRSVLNKVLRAKGGSGGEAVAAGLEATKIPAISLGLGDYARAKAEHIRAMGKQGGEQARLLAEALMKGSAISGGRAKAETLDFSEKRVADFAGMAEETLGYIQDMPTMEVPPVVLSGLGSSEEPYESITIEDPELEEEIAKKYAATEKKVGDLLTPESVMRTLEQVPDSARAIIKDYLSNPENGSISREQVLAVIETIPDPNLAEKIRGWIAPVQKDVPEEKHGERFLSHSAEEVLWALGSQIPCVEPLAETVKAGVRKVFGIRGGADRTSEKKLMAAMGTVLASEMVISSLADNIAAYLFGEKVLTDMAKEVYGEKVLEENPDLGDALYAATIKLAEQAGSLTKFGNGPNFSQERIVGSLDEKGNLAVKREAIPFEWYKNQYANIANGALFALSLRMVGKELSKLEKKK